MKKLFWAMPVLVPHTLWAPAAFADSIDGDWCLNEGRHFAINGPTIETPGGRIAFGPVGVADVPGLVTARFASTHRLCLGRPEDLPFLKRQTRITFARCGIVDPLSLADYRATGGWKGMEKARSLGPAATLEEVTKSGLRGRGGAGFPTGIKWKTVADTAADRKYIVCNADEGDSGTFSDRMLMEGDPFLLLEGMTIAGLAVGATEGFIYLRIESPHAARTLAAAITAAERISGSATAMP